MEDTKRRILRVADDQFHRYGVRSVSMDDIARELGMSKKTIYQCYKDKEELVRNVTLEHVEMEKKEFSEVFESSENAIDELYSLSKCLRKNMADINPSLLFDLQKFHPSSWSIWEDFKNTFIKEAVIRVIERGKEEGVFRKEINAHIMATYRIETIQMAFDQKIFPKENFDLADLQLELFDHFVHGLLTSHGKEQFDKLRNSNTNDT